VKPIGLVEQLHERALPAEPGRSRALREFFEEAQIFPIVKPQRR